MDLIEVNDEFRLLICRRCEAAVKPGTKLIDHMRDKHNTTRADLQYVKQAYSFFNMNNSETVDLPLP